MVGRCDVELAAGDLLDTGADAICLGHIHRHQVLDERIVYAGGIRQCTYGEDPKKGYCLLAIERGRAPVVTHRQGPGRELVTIEAAWPLEPSPAGNVGKLVSDNDVPIEEEALVRPGAALRLVYSVSEDHRQQAAEQADTARQRWLAAGAHGVKVDARIIATHRVRSDEIQAARTTTAKLEALWTSRGQRPASAERLLGKLATLETEVMP
jgi:exonuclease SbcD